MSEITDKQEAQKAKAEAARAEFDSLCETALEIFRTDSGQELLGHLAKRFDMLGRTFVPNQNGEVNALRAAVRDGEKATVSYLVAMCRRIDPKFTFPI
jgi:hypothetical protein